MTLQIVARVLAVTLIAAALVVGLALALFRWETVRGGMWASYPTMVRTSDWIGARALVVFFVAALALAVVELWR